MWLEIILYNTTEWVQAIITRHNLITRNDGNLLILNRPNFVDNKIVVRHPTTAVVGILVIYIYIY